MSSKEEAAGIKIPKERSLHSHSLPPMYAPSLVYSHGKKYQDQIFFTLSDGCHHATRVPEMCGMRCAASCYGWLLLHNYFSTECYIFDPVSLTKIHLPPMIHSSFKIGVLTSPPTDCNCVIMFFSEKRKSCQFCRIGDSSWIEQKLGSDKKSRERIQGPFEAALSCLGKIYLFFKEIAVIDVYDSFVSVKLHESKFLYLSRCTSNYFLESCDDIFQVIGLHLGVTANIFRSFVVFKLDFSTMDWVKVGSIGNRIFLLGEVSSSISATDSGVKGNCIYFYRPRYTNLYKYDMDDGSVTISLPCPKQLPHWLGPYWVVPNCKTQVNKYVAKVLKSKGEVKGEWSWEDLPIELVPLIASSLSLGDCIRFRLICKTWISITSPLRSNPPLIQSNSESQQLPWLMSIPVTNKGACSFYHPIYGDTYTMDIPEIAGALIHDSKYGWLLLSRENTSLFFFNPLTMENIKLPNNEDCHDLAGVSFSSPPTSSDCVVFGITRYHEKFVEMLIYSKNDEDSWYDFRVDTKVPYEFMASDCNPIFCDGVFYCLSKDGKLGCFNPMERDDDDLIWKVLPVPPVFCFSKLMDFTTDIRGFLGEYDGEIISVFVGVDGKQIEVYKLDRSEIKWARLDNLGDKVLFLGQTTCMLVTARLKGIENRIYLPRFKGNANVFYALSSCQYHWFGEKEARVDWIDTSEHWNCEWILPMLPV